MNKHRVKNFFKIGRISSVTRVLVVAGLLVVSVAGSGQQAGAVQTSADYCKQFIDVSLSACKDGILGTVDCNEYADVSTQGDVTICNNAKNAKKSGAISDTPSASQTPTPTPTTNPAIDSTAYRNNILLTCASYGDTTQQLACLYGGLGKNGSSSSPTSIADCYTALQFLSNPDAQKACSTGAQAGQTYINSQTNQNGSNSSAGSFNNPFSSLDLNDMQGNLSDYINTLHANGTDSKVNTSNFSDNNPNSYVNGAGGQQPIKVMPSGKPNSPALIWFNGGGWHANDGTAELIASGSTQKNGQSDQASTGAAPVGGGANARGYTVIEVTYRLGSSGVNYMFEDVMRGIQHVINNAKLYNIDPSKIAIGGDSAGGSLSMRAVATGKSGAKVGIGWSAPTNGYTALFKSYKTFLLGMDHSTCIPTDLAGLANTTDLLNGGSGNVAQYGQGLSSNEFDNLGLSQDPSGLPSGFTDPSGNPLLVLGQVMSAAQYASSSSQNIEAISKQIENKNFTGLASGVFNLSAHKLTECIGNFNSLSPALFASTETPPSFLVDFDTDDVVDPQQAYDMVDKLQQMGIRAESLIVPGDPDASQNVLGPSGNHLGYDPRFVCATLNFMDSVIQPGVQVPDCSKPGSVGQSISAAAPVSLPSASSGASSSNPLSSLLGVGSSPTDTTSSALTNAQSSCGSNLSDASSFTDCLGSLSSLRNLLNGGGSSSSLSSLTSLFGGSSSPSTSQLNSLLSNTNGCNPSDLSSLASCSTNSSSNTSTNSLLSLIQQGLKLGGTQ